MLVIQSVTVKSLHVFVLLFDRLFLVFIVIVIVLPSDVQFEFVLTVLLKTFCKLACIATICFHCF